MTLLDKVIVITGAGRGIGRAIAVAAAQQGARVAVLDNGSAADGAGTDGGPSREVVETIVAAGGEAMALAVDVEDLDQVRAGVAEVLARWGRIDGIVNNAGIIIPGDFTQQAPADFERQIRVNLYGAFNMAQAVAQHFKAQESGAFVHMTSSVGLIGSPGLAGYASSKLGIVGLSRTLSFDMAKFKVRSNCVAPSAATRMTDSGGDSPQAKAYVKRMQQVSPAEKVAPLVLFLLADATQAVTGQIFGCRGDTIFLYDQPRPIRIAQRGRGWTAQSIASEVMPSWRSSLVPLETTSDIIRLPEIAS